jgi:acetyl-CoA carboxylase alpha subunit/acetyl-CoA carboxylase beta subunit
MAHGSFEKLRDVVFDQGSWRSWDSPLAPSGVDPAYAAALARARAASRQDEAVLTGEATLRGRRVAVIAGEFGFLAGSVGVDAARRLLAAIERATAERLPLLGMPASAGTRMQEGTIAFVQMIGVCAAIGAHKRTGLPYVVYLRDPTFGGVLASWGSLGHLTFAEPRAAIGFLGPRVYEALHGAPFPPGVQTSENLARHGVIDAIVPPGQFAELADRALRVMTPSPASRGARQAPSAAGDAFTPADGVEHRAAWDVVTSSRRPGRPGVWDLLAASATDVVALAGRGTGEHGAGLVLALARFAGAGCVVLGHDRRAQAESGLLGPVALRTARRGMGLAEELRLPLVTLIDTQGAALSREAEEGGLAAEIARCLHDLVTLRSPTLAVLLGQGAGGGALALLPADRVLSAANGWLAPLPPEGASAIVYRDTGHAPELAERQGIAALDLRRAGIVDRIVPERPDATDEPEQFCLRLGHAIGQELAGLAGWADDERRNARLGRYRALGRS